MNPTKKYPRPVDLGDVRATIVEEEPGVYIVESCGGGRNMEYNRGLEILLDRLRKRERTITSVQIKSRTCEDFVFPQIDGYGIDRLTSDLRDSSLEIRKAIGRAVAKAGRKPGAKGTGNSQKRIRITTE